MRRHDDDFWDGPGMTDKLALLAAWLLVIGLAVLTVVGIWLVVVLYILALS